jgi:hypothetical protein
LRRSFGFIAAILASNSFLASVSLSIYAYDFGNKNYASDIRSRLLWAVSGEELGEKIGRFGSKIAIAGDGRILLIGAPLANNGGYSPDGDQRGVLVSVPIL